MTWQPRAWPLYTHTGYPLQGDLIDLSAHRPLHQNTGAVDPVCGMTVDPARTPHHCSHGGETYYFCGERCRSKFVADPPKYLSGDAATAAQPAAAGTIYTCPMHPEVRQDKPGACPICGMALEPLEPAAGASNPELPDMRRRFWIGAALAVPTVVLAMGGHLPALNLHRLVAPQLSVWLQFLFTTPVVLWAGWPFLVRGWASVRNRALNMFTLISLGVA